MNLISRWVLDSSRFSVPSRAEKVFFWELWRKYLPYQSRQYTVCRFACVMQVKCLDQPPYKLLCMSITQHLPFTCPRKIN